MNLSVAAARESCSYCSLLVFYARGMSLNFCFLSASAGDDLPMMTSQLLSFWHLSLPLTPAPSPPSMLYHVFLFVVWPWVPWLGLGPGWLDGCSLRAVTVCGLHVG